MIPASTRRAPSGVAITLGDAPEPEAWDALVTVSAAPHPHFSRHVVEAASDRRRCCRRPYATSRSGEGDRLVALLPYRAARDLVGPRRPDRCGPSSRPT
ncbi:hypothetical protein ACU4GR_11080 [Methylobacterium oryzae CBMB20]